MRHPKPPGEDLVLEFQFFCASDYSHPQSPIQKGIQMFFVIAKEYSFIYLQGFQPSIVVKNAWRQALQLVVGQKPINSQSEFDAVY